jgi:hypothetical protein
MYFNLFLIHHSILKFIWTFINIMFGVLKAKVIPRIILTPQHAKRLAKALADNVRKFEQAQGEIKDSEKPPIPMNFVPTGKAYILLKTKLIKIYIVVRVKLLS